MSRTVAVPDELYDRALEVAARDCVSVEDFISTALATRLASRDYIASRAARFDLGRFERALAGIPDVEPDENDRRLSQSMESPDSPPDSPRASPVR